MLIGDEKISEFSERKSTNGVLRLLTPTDCIKDRLAAYIHWKDKQALDQALMVTKAQPFNLTKIKEFCISEGSPAAFEGFTKQLGAIQKT